MPVFMDPATEFTAALVMLVLATPAVLLLCYVFEEAPLKSKETFEDIPILHGLAANDCVGQTEASLCCFFMVAGAIILFSAASGMWLMVWRGSVMALPGGSSVSGTIGALAFLERGVRAPKPQLLAHVPSFPRYTNRTLATWKAMAEPPHSLRPFGSALQIAAEPRQRSLPLRAARGHRSS